MKRAAIIGATSGIGLELARQMAQRGYIVGGCGRRADVLQNLKNELGDRFCFTELDIQEVETIPQILNELVRQMGGMDICIISSSISEANPEMDWAIEQNVIQTNVLGYAAAANFAARYFRQQRQGHLVGITSVAKFFGNRNPSYSASKAFESIYLRGLRLTLERSGVQVTEIIPGFVRTPMISDQKKTFWVLGADKAAAQIIRAVGRKRRVAFIPKRWIIFGLIIPLLPHVFLKRIL